MTDKKEHFCVVKREREGAMYSQLNSFSYVLVVAKGIIRIVQPVAIERFPSSGGLLNWMQ